MEIIFKHLNFFTFTAMIVFPLICIPMKQQHWEFFISEGLYKYCKASLPCLCSSPRCNSSPTTLKAPVANFYFQSLVLIFYQSFFSFTLLVSSHTVFMLAFLRMFFYAAWQRTPFCTACDFGLQPIDFFTMVGKYIRQRSFST